MGHTMDAGECWEDLSRDLENPESLTEYLAASAEIERIDARYRPT
jgi:hypothetical protein